MGVRCRDCGHEWQARPAYFFNGGACPKCAVRQHGDKIRFSHKEAIARLRKIKPSIEPLGQYKGARGLMDFRCRECGYEWNAKFGSLLYGIGCPGCAEYGFQPNKPAIVYYVRIAAESGQFVYKIGITIRTVRERLRNDYERLTVIEIWSFELGAEARALEQKVLREHRAHRYHGPRVFIDANNREVFTCDVLGLDTQGKAARDEKRSGLEYFLTSKDAAAIAIGVRRCRLPRDGAG
jgi:predicted  nucleic acid-binding Zn-ribbon protein